VFVKKKLPEQFGLHCYAVNTHLDEIILEPPSKKSWIRLCGSPHTSAYRQQRWAMAILKIALLPPSLFDE